MTPLADKTRIVIQVCDALAASDTGKASKIARKAYPFAPRTKAETKLYIKTFAATSVVLRNSVGAGSVVAQLGATQPVSTRSPFSAFTSTSIFMRDGFVDCYAGTQLVFPGVLRLLSLLLPADFPWDPHWNPSVSHIISWDLCPTVDHVVPLSRGGTDTEDNWVTTSMVLNNVKGKRTLDELGWSPPRSLNSDATDWDGLMGWFLDFISRSPQHLAHNYIKTWHSAAKRVSESGLTRRCS
jgi:5-methylcytosine-specific restriction endonuclease McrA